MNRPVFLSFVLAVLAAAGVFAGEVPGGEEPPVHLRGGWPPPLAAAWFREPETSNPLGDIAAQVEAAKNLEDARWPSPKADNSSAVAAAGWAALLRQFRAFGPALADKAGTEAGAAAVRRDWALAEALFGEKDAPRSGELVGSAQGMFDVETKSRIAWHFLRAGLLADARSEEWAAVRDAPGEWNGCSFALTNGFFQARWALDRETTGPADELETWHVFADPEAVRRDEETGDVVADLLFVPAEPYGLPSDAGQKDRFRLDGGRLVPADDGD